MTEEEKKKRIEEIELQTTVLVNMMFPDCLSCVDQLEPLLQEYFKLTKYDEGISKIILGNIANEYAICSREASMGHVDWSDKDDQTVRNISSCYKRMECLGFFSWFGDPDILTDIPHNTSDDYYSEWEPMTKQGIIKAKQIGTSDWPFISDKE